MPYIEPITPGEIRDPELAALVARCERLGVPDSLFPRILARVPAYAKALLRAMLLSHTEGNVDHQLKEIIRIQLARRAGDPYFAKLRSAKAMADGLDEAAIAAGCDDYERSPAKYGSPARRASCTRMISFSLWSTLPSVCESSIARSSALA